MDLQLGRFFDENCIEKKTQPGRDPMKIHLLHQSPPVLRIDNFFTKEDCAAIKTATSTAHQVDSATFKGALSTRTSTSWFCHFEDVPLLLAKANRILNIPLDAMEEPQVVRYRRGQEFSWHYDEVPASQLNNGGQRLATLLVYLNDLVGEDCGGGTAFRDLFLADKKTPLVMQPKQGSALLFFPAFRNGTPDDRTLHRSEVMTCDAEKWIVQMWVHKDAYQAVLPPGNSNVAARSKMEEMIKQLGYE
jgi:prolyl 4-hydroxylase